MGPQVAFIDANVIFSKTLRDWICLLRLETGGHLFVLHTSEEALTEAAYKLRKKMPDAPGDSIRSIIEHVRNAVDDIVVSFPSGASFPGADKDDRHIHAAAKASGADYLLTQDAGFAGIDPDLLPYEVITPDLFFALVAANNPAAADRVIRRQLKYFDSKPDVKGLSEALMDAKCEIFAECVKRHLERMAHGQSTVGLSQQVLKECSGQVGCN